MMKAAALVLALATATVTAADQSRPARGRAAQPAASAMTVYKSPTCGCCAKWVDHMRANGFTVTVQDMPDVQPIKAKHGVPSSLTSCHTGIIGGYVVEGHIPAATVKKLLVERPAIAGIAVPGMPMGSPGMEGPANIRPRPYDVMTFDKKGATKVFATIQP
jgi:hypothetical protein